MWLAACSSGLAAVAAPLRPRIATESFRCHCSNIQWQLMLQHWQFFFSGLERAADTNVKQKENPPHPSLPLQYQLDLVLPSIRHQSR